MKRYSDLCELCVFMKKRIRKQHRRDAESTEVKDFHWNKYSGLCELRVSAVNFFSLNAGFS
jgi:hypothetical protein